MDYKSISGDELQKTVDVSDSTEYSLFTLLVFILLHVPHPTLWIIYGMINPKSGTWKFTWRRGCRAWTTSIFSRPRPHGSSILDRTLHCHYRPFLPFMDLYLHLPGKDVDAIIIRVSLLSCQGLSKSLDKMIILILKM